MFHVVWTEYEGTPGEELMVMYRSGKVLSNSVTGTRETWSGVVLLDSDFTVDAGDTLTIVAGTRVYAQTPNDVSVGDPPDPGSDLVDLIVRGQLVVQDSAGIPPVVFAGTRGSTAGEWGGITFELEGAYASGYGYVGCEEPLSSIKNAHIENGEYGIRIRDHCAPSLSGVTFASITNERHVMLDSTDVIIPLVFNPADSSEIVGMGSWSLAKTKVVAANGVRFGQDLIGGDSKADLIVYGALNTSGSAAQGDSVYFRPETITSVSSSTAGADWGGIAMSSSAEENLIEYADIGYAANPLFMYYPDSGDIIRVDE
jgi:hypothetical protein